MISTINFYIVKYTKYGIDTLRYRHTTRQGINNMFINNIVSTLRVLEAACTLSIINEKYLVKAPATGIAIYLETSKNGSENMLNEAFLSH